MTTTVSNPSVLTIGKLAEAAGINIETVRYYERRNLIEQPTKPEHGYRKYPQATLERILFIKRAQELGFTLDEITTLLTLSETSCHEVQDLAEQKLDTVQAKIEDLQRLQTVLNNLVIQCQNNPDQSQCPIIESLLPSRTPLDPVP